MAWTVLSSSLMEVFEAVNGGCVASVETHMQYRMHVLISNTGRNPSLGAIDWLKKYEPVASSLSPVLALQNTAVIIRA